MHCICQYFNQRLIANVVASLVNCEPQRLQIAKKGGNTALKIFNLE
jgi:hypothetical protein